MKTRISAVVACVTAFWVLACSLPRGEAQRPDEAAASDPMKKKKPQHDWDPKEKIPIAPPVPVGGKPPRSSDIPLARVSVQQFGTAETDRLGSLVSSGGAIYVGGATGGPLAGKHAGGSDAWIRRYAPNGETQLWETQFGCRQDDEVRAMDVEGDLVVATGQTEGSLVDGHDGAPAGDCFLAGFDTDGKQRFLKQFGSSQMDECLGVVIHGDAIYVAGGSLGDLDGQKVGDEDMFLRRFDRKGNLVWGRHFGSARFEEALGLTAGPKGLYLVGMTDGKWETQLGQTDMVVMKVGFDGTQEWVRQIGTSEIDNARSVFVDGNALYVAGHSAGKMGAGHFGAGDAVTARLEEATGDIVWVDQFGTDLSDGAGAVTVRDGKVWVLASILSPGKHTPGAGSIEVVIRRLTLDGRVEYTGRLGSVSDDRGLGFGIGDERVWVVGETAGHFGGQNPGKWDAFLATARRKDLE